MDKNKRQTNINDYLANERTFLAWIQTSIGIMVFGFVVVKFSLFVKHISLLLDTQSNIVVEDYSTSLGIALVSIGMWKDGTMSEEYLFWDNQTYMNQLGLGK